MAGSILCGLFFSGGLIYGSLHRIQESVLYHEVEFYVAVFHAQSSGGEPASDVSVPESTVSQAEFNALKPTKWGELETLSVTELSGLFIALFVFVPPGVVALAWKMRCTLFADMGDPVCASTGPILCIAGVVVGSTAEFVAEGISPLSPVLVAATWTGFYVGYRLLSQERAARRALLLTVLLYGGCMCLQFLRIPFGVNTERLHASYQAVSTQKQDDAQTGQGEKHCPFLPVAIHPIRPWKRHDHRTARARPLPDGGRGRDWRGQGAPGAAPVTAFEGAAGISRRRSGCAGRPAAGC